MLIYLAALIYLGSVLSSNVHRFGIGSLTSELLRNYSEEVES
jgi:hypothetical protein